MAKRGRSKMAPETDLQEYYSKLSPEEKEWAKKFYREYYGVDFYGEEENIIKDKEIKSEAHRNHNSQFRDALSVAEKTGSLRDLTDSEREFMEAASDEWEYMDAYKLLGYGEALKVLILQTERDILKGGSDLKVVLARFIVKFNNLKRIHGRRGTQK